MNIADIIQELKSNASPSFREGMARFGINIEKALGVPVPALRKLAGKIGKNQDISIKLWNTDIHEARILAGILGEPKLVTPGQMDEWAGDFNSWDLCDQCCGNLFDKTPYAYKKCREWSVDEREFVKRAGFALMACLAVHDREADDECFSQFFPIIEKQAADERNFVKKAVNWALRQIGKRNTNLNARAILVANKIMLQDSKTAKWIANDALRELEHPQVKKRLEKQKQKDNGGRTDTGHLETALQKPLTFS